MLVSTRRLLLAIVLMFGVSGGAALEAATAPHEASRKILVFGGSGQLGSQVVRALIGAGHDVTVFVRPTSERDRLADLKVHYIQG